MKTDIADNNLKTGAPDSGMYPEGEVAAAIGAALALYTGHNVHDRESYVITIRRKRRERDVCYLN